MRRLARLSPVCPFAMVGVVLGVTSVRRAVALSRCNNLRCSVAAAVALSRCKNLRCSVAAAGGVCACVRASTPSGSVVSARRPARTLVPRFRPPSRPAASTLVPPAVVCLRHRAAWTGFSALGRSARTFALATAAGTLPGCVLYAWIGASVRDAGDARGPPAGEPSVLWGTLGCSGVRWGTMGYDGVLLGTTPCSSVLCIPRSVVRRAA